MIWIDFHGSTHGHFLEYVTNVWIMKMPAETNSVFTESGACHNFSDYYKDNRGVRCGHLWWSDYKNQYVNECMIRITFDKASDRSFYIAQVNRWYRSGDVSFENKLLDIAEEVRNSPERFRNQYYHKYIIKDGYQEFPNRPNPIQEFKFESLFVWSEFCTGLHDIANFLNKQFVPDNALYNLWQEFISRNQGYQSYQRCEQILENVFSGQAITISCTPYEEAWLNYNITKMCGIDKGPLFDCDKYPTNTLEIFNLIQPHV